MNKYLYIGAIVGGSILTWLFVALGSNRHTSEMMAAVPLPLLLVLVFHLMMVYKMWAALQSGVHRTTPGKAAGFLLIPFFNIYWLFNVYVGFAKDYNATIAAHGKNTEPLKEGLFIANCALILIPIPIVNWIVAAMTISKIADTVNGLESR